MRVKSPYLWQCISGVASEHGLCSYTATTLYNLAETRFFGQNMRLKCVLVMAGYDAITYRFLKGNNR